MYAYCNNDPILLQDSSGSRPIIGGGLRDETAEQRKLSFSYINPQIKSPYNVGSGPYGSADAAAIAFASNTYSKTAYSRHEYGAAIYAQTKNGVTTYNYTTPIAGNPHNIKLGRIQVPSGTKKVATIHTHPRANNFSGRERNAVKGDIPVARRRGINSYVVGPSLNVRKYTVSTNDNSIIGTAYPIALTSWQKEALLAEFQISWDSHFESCKYSNCNPGDFPGR